MKENKTIDLAQLNKNCHYVKNNLYPDYLIYDGLEVKMEILNNKPIVQCFIKQSQAFDPEQLLDMASYSPCV